MTFVQPRAPGGLRPTHIAIPILQPLKDLISADKGLVSRTLSSTDIRRKTNLYLPFNFPTERGGNIGQ